MRFQKISELSPMCGVWDVENFQAIPCILAVGLKKCPTFHLCMSSKKLKNSKLSPIYKPWDFENCQAPLLFMRNSGKFVFTAPTSIVSAYYRF